MKYFKDCKTIDEAKQRFRILCMELHPDTSGRNSQQEFINMYKEFKSFVPSQDKYNQKESFNPDEFYNLIKKFDHIENIEISFIGTFIWLFDKEGHHGAMYRQKEQIKDIKIDGYNTARFARKKKSWFFSPEGYKKKSRKKFSKEELKNLFGSFDHKTKGRERLN